MTKSKSICTSLVALPVQVTLQHVSSMVICIVLAALLWEKQIKSLEMSWRSKKLQKSPTFSQPFSPLSRHVAIQEIGPKKKSYCYTYSICIIYKYYGLQIYSNMATHNTCLTQAWRCDIRFLRKESISRRLATYSQVPLKKIFRDAIQRTRRSGFARSLLNLHISNILHNIGIRQKCVS
jgi:hypothetical protein